MQIADVTLKPWNSGLIDSQAPKYQLSDQNRSWGFRMGVQQILNTVTWSRKNLIWVMNSFHITSWWRKNIAICLINSQLYTPNKFCSSYHFPLSMSGTTTHLVLPAKDVEVILDLSINPVPLPPSQHIFHSVHGQVSFTFKVSIGMTHFSVCCYPSSPGHTTSLNHYSTIPTLSQPRPFTYYSQSIRFDMQNMQTWSGHIPTPHSLFQFLKYAKGFSLLGKRSD